MECSVYCFFGHLLYISSSIPDIKLIPQFPRFRVQILIQGWLTWIRPFLLIGMGAGGLIRVQDCHKKFGKEMVSFLETFLNWEWLMTVIFPTIWRETACKMKLRTDKKKVEMEGEENPGKHEILVLPLKPWFLLNCS